MRLTDLLALSHVPRWSIVPHHLPQNVGDHTFRVLVIFVELAHNLGVEYTKRDLLEILVHDGPESRTGDIPTPAKRLMTMPTDDKFCPWVYPANFSTIATDLLFRISDLVEAYSFIQKWGVGPHAKHVAADLYAALSDLVKAELTPDQNRVVTTLVDDIVFDKGRWPLQP